MTAMQIRDVPEDVRDALAAQAAASGQSLQGYLLALVTERARMSRNALLLRRMEGRDDGTPAGVVDTVADLAAVRQPRDP